MSRRAADAAIQQGRVKVNGTTATLGDEINSHDSITINDKIVAQVVRRTIVLNKPVGYVCSRNGQGSKTIYNLLPRELHHLKPVGRLDKDSSGLLLLTNDGELANQLTHPRYGKEKVYEVELDKELKEEDKRNIEQGVKLEDGPSKLALTGSGTSWIVTMHEGRNRQIRRTFAASGYRVAKLHRTKFGPYTLNTIKPSETQAL